MVMNPKEFTENTAMKIGITSQNFRTITGHAGKTRRFLVYSVREDKTIHAEPRIDLPKEMSLHEYHGEDHPAYGLDVIITAGCGDNFRQRMQRHGVQVIATSETDPMQAVQRYLAEEPLAPAAPHEYSHA